MRQIAVGLSALLALLAPAGPVLAESAHPTFHEEAGRLLDQVTEQIRNLGAQIGQRMHPDQWGQRGRDGMMGPGSPAERPLITLMLEHRTDLGLTGEQVSRLEALRADFTRAAIRRDAEIRIAELDLATLLEQDPVDLARVEAKVREAAQLRADLRVARLRTLEQGKAVLTTEQKTRLRALLGDSAPGPRRSAAVGL